MANFGEVLSGLMIEANLNSKMFAEKIGVTPATVSTWKSNIHGIQLSNLVAICRLFNCSLDYLVGRTDNDRKPSKFEIENFGKRVRDIMKQKGKSHYHHATANALYK